MATVRFIHTADLHLDTPFKGLYQVNSELASRLKNATMRTFQRIIDLCIDEKADFLLVAGDIFDSEAKSLGAQLGFAKELNRLSSAGIPAYIITGNHDPLNSWMKELAMPLNVHRFGGSQVEKVTFTQQGVPLADIYGISFATREVEHNLATSFELQPGNNPFSVALLHGTISSATSPHPYAPFTISDIKGKGFDYWALGHIHKRQIVNPAHPAVVYPGNPQGRDFGETGPRGVYMVTLQEGSDPAIDFIPTHQIQFEELKIDIGGITNFSEMQDKIEQEIEEVSGSVPGVSFIFRITLTGRSELHGSLVKPGEAESITALLNEGQLMDDYFRWVDRIEIQTTPDLNLDELAKGSDFTGALLCYVNGLNEERINELIVNAGQDFTNAKARKEIVEFSPEEKLDIIEKAKWMLLDQLIK